MAYEKEANDAIIAANLKEAKEKQFAQAESFYNAGYSLDEALAIVKGICEEYAPMLTAINQLWTRMWYKDRVDKPEA